MAGGKGENSQQKDANNDPTDRLQEDEEKNQALNQAVGQTNPDEEEKKQLLNTSPLTPSGNDGAKHASQHIVPTPGPTSSQSSDNSDRDPLSQQNQSPPTTLTQQQDQPPYTPAPTQQQNQPPPNLNPYPPDLPDFTQNFPRYSPAERERNASNFANAAIGTAAVIAGIVGTPAAGIAVAAIGYGLKKAAERFLPNGLSSVADGAKSLMNMVTPRKKTFAEKQFKTATKEFYKLKEQQKKAKR